MHVEVILIDRDRLTGEGEVDGAWWHNVLGGFERELTFLGHADEHHAFVGPKASSIPSSNVVFALASLELNERHQVTAGEPGDVLNKAIVQWTKRSR